MHPFCIFFVQTATNKRRKLDDETFGNHRFLVTWRQDGCLLKKAFCTPIFPIVKYVVRRIKSIICNISALNFLKTTRFLLLFCWVGPHIIPNVPNNVQTQAREIRSFIQGSSGFHLAACRYKQTYFWTQILRRTLNMHKEFYVSHVLPLATLCVCHVQVLEMCSTVLCYITKTVKPQVESGDKTQKPSVCCDIRH